MLNKQFLSITTTDINMNSCAVDWTSEEAHFSGNEQEKPYDRVHPINRRQSPKYL